MSDAPITKPSALGGPDRTASDFDHKLNATIAADPEPSHRSNGILHFSTVTVKTDPSTQTTNDAPSLPRLDLDLTISGPANLTFSHDLDLQLGFDTSGHFVNSGGAQDGLMFSSDASIPDASLSGNLSLLTTSIASEDADATATNAVAEIDGKRITPALLQTHKLPHTSMTGQAGLESGALAAPAPSLVPSPASALSPVEGPASVTGPDSDGNVGRNTLSGQNYIDSLLSYDHWGTGPMGTAVTLDYSFGVPGVSRYGGPGGIFYGDGQDDTMQACSPKLQETIISVLQLFEKVANITFNLVTDSDTVAGDLRFAVSDKPETSEAYTPDNTSEAGDVWFGSGRISADDYDPNYTMGSYDYFVVLHEIAHALGLKHPDEADGFANVLATPENDTTAVSLVSYRNYVGDDRNDGHGQDFSPTTPMLNDIAALQFIYGVNNTTRNGDTTYSWTPGQQILETIWDGGGKDTISWENQSRGALINLAQESWSRLGVGYDREDGSIVKDTLMIARNVNIEHAIGGTGNDTIKGNSLGNRLSGGEGKDRITGLNGYDSLDGGGNNDSLDGGTGNDTLVGGTGIDTLVGGTGIDSMDGGDDNDSLSGGAENDTLTGGGGNDTLDGGSGADSMTGGAGNDTYILRDVLDAIIEDDRILDTDTVSSSLHSTVLGANLENLTLTSSATIGTGNTLDNTITGNAENNSLAGGSGEDTIYGGLGNDTLFGENDNDSLSGGDGIDNIDGGSGNDTIDGGVGNDILAGGEGNDILDGSYGADDIDGGAGFDIVSFISSTSAITLDLANPATSTGAAIGDSYIDVEGYEGTIKNDVMRGSTAGDRFYGQASNDKLFGSSGDDTLAGDAGADSLNGGEDFDTASYIHSATGVTVDLALATAQTGAGDQNGDVLTSIEGLEGSNQNDTLRGDTLANTFSGLDGNDSIQGLGGNDTLDGGIGNDTLEGGNDDDYFVSGAGADQHDGGDGTDTASYLTSTAAVNVRLNGTPSFGGHSAGDILMNIENVEGSDLTAGGDTILGNAYANSLLGLAGNDSLTGAVGDDTLKGGEGNDTLLGGTEDDCLSGGSGADSIDGGDGADWLDYTGSGTGVVLDLMSISNDVGTGTAGDANGDHLAFVEHVDGSTGNDTLLANSQGNFLRGNSGNDSLHGRDGEDFLEGGTGSDILRGGNHNDNLVAGDGNDSLYGEAGDDAFFGQAGADFINGGTGTDLLSYRDSPAAVTVNLGTAATSGDALGDVLVLVSPGVSTLENLEGSGGNDKLTGDEQPNVLWGRAGADSIVGGAGNDTLHASESLFGADSGADTLNGGVGIDWLSYAEAQGSTGVTVSLLTGLGSGGDAAGDVISFIENCAGSPNADALSGDNAGNVLFGNAGNDTLDGLAGADSMEGNAGNDLYRIDHIADQVKETAGEGTDTIRTIFTTHLKDALSAWGNLTTFENLTLEGLADLNGTGNISSNFIQGNTGKNILMPGAGGSDTLNGLAGDDRIDGGDGNDLSGDSLNGGSNIDTLDYSRSSQAVYVNLGGATQIAQTRASEGDGNKGAAYNDSISGFENIIGSLHSDSLVGGDGNNTIDILQGFDTVDGGNGTDVLKYDWSAVPGDNGVKYDAHDPATGSGNMRAHQNFVGDTARVTYANFERFDLTGTSVGDDLRGDTLNDTLNGLTGNDWLTSYGGVDTVNGGTGNDTLWSGSWSGQTEHLDFDNSDGRVTFADGTSITSIEAFRNLELGSGKDNVIFIGNFNDSASLGGGNDTINIGQGFDTLNGGEGTDVLKYDWSTITGDNGVKYDAHDLTTGSGNMRFHQNFVGDTARIVYERFERFDLTGTIVGDDLRGDTLSDTLNGFTGDDGLTSYGGIDTINGGTGNDTLWSGLWSGLTAGQDFDNSGKLVVLSNGTRIANIEAFSDLQLGAGADNVVFIGAFNDSATLGGGNDTIVIGQGFDAIDGGGGTDVLKYDWSAVSGDNGVKYDAHEPATGSGNMRVHQNFVGDTARVTYANFERFDLTGSSVGDDLRGGNLNDTLKGFTGDDILASYGGSDIIDGGEGTDRLSDGLWLGLNANQDFDNTDKLVVLSDGTRIANIEAFSNLQLGAGADNVVFIGAFNDSATLGGGNDTIVIGEGFDTIDGGGGTDLLKYDWSTVTGDNGVKYDAHEPATGSGNMRVHQNFVDDTARVTYANFERFDLTGSSVADDLRGGNLNDTLKGITGDDTLASYGGSDIIDGGEGTDRLSDGLWLGLNANQDFDNTDKLVVLSNGTRIANIEAFSNLQLGAGADKVVFTGSFDDTASLGGGNDTIDIGQGFDSIDGGAGTDILKYDWSAVSGDNGVTYDDHDLTTGSGNMRFHQNFVGDTARIVYEHFERFDLTGTIVGDDLRGDTLNDTLNGFTGDDGLTSHGGVDIINGGTGNDTLWSGLWSAQTEHLDFDNSDGRVTFADGTSITSIQAFRDLQLGSGNDNVVFIGAFNDSATLGGGNDTIDIGQGFDSVDGGDGIDVLKYDWSTVTGDNGVFYDSHDLTTGSGNMRFHQNFVGDTARITYSNFERFDLTGTIVGDDLRGAALNDTLRGMAGADVLTGGEGNDTLDGGADTDRMIGGKGNDVYVVADTGDIIEENASEGTDDVSASATYTLAANVDNLVLTGAAVINGTGNSTANNLTGNGAANELTGGIGKDSLIGGGGNDTLNGASADAPFGKGEIDTLTGGAGNDTFILGTTAAVLYNDGLNANAGRADYALITDFTVGQDKLQLDGSASQYYLGAHGIADLAGSGLWLEQGATDELIAVLRPGSATALTTANTIATAAYV